MSYARMFRLTPLAFALAALAGCGGGGDSTSASSTTISGVASNSPLIGVPMSLTCGDGSTTVTTTAGTSAAPGAYSFSVPTTCTGPYLIQATGPGTMRPLDGSPDVPYDPTINTPLKTVSFDSSNVNVTPVTTLVAQQALDSVGSGGTLASVVGKDSDLNSFRSNVAKSLPNTGATATTPDAIKAAVNASPAQSPDVVQLSAVIAQTVEDAVAADASGKTSPANVISTLKTDISAQKNLSDPNNISSTTLGIDKNAIKEKATALSNLANAAINDLGATNTSSLTPATVIGDISKLVTAAQNTPLTSANQTLLQNAATAQILSQTESSITTAVQQFASSNLSQAAKAAKIAAVQQGADLIAQNQLSAFNSAITSALKSSGTVNVSNFAAQAQVAAQVMGKAVGNDTGSTFVQASGAINVASMAGLAAQALHDLSGQTAATLNDPSQIQAIKQAVGNDAAQVGTALANFTPPAGGSSGSGGAGSSGSGGAPSLNTQALQAAVLAVIQQTAPPSGSLTQLPQLNPTQLGNLGQLVNNTATALQNSLSGSAGSAFNGAAPSTVISNLVQTVQTNNALGSGPVNLNNAPPTVGPITTITPPTTTTLPPITLNNPITLVPPTTTPPTGTTPPSGGTTTPPPSGGTTTPPPSGGSTTPPPSGGTTTPPPSGGSTTPPPSGGTTTPPPSGGTTTPPPSGGTTTPPPSGGTTTPPPSGGSTTPPPSGGSTTPPPSGGSTTPPPSGGSTTPPPSGGTTTPPPSGGTTTPPPSGGTTTPPPTH